MNRRTLLMFSCPKNAALSSLNLYKMAGVDPSRPIGSCSACFLPCLGSPCHTPIIGCSVLSIGNAASCKIVEDMKGLKTFLFKKLSTLKQSSEHILYFEERKNSQTLAVCFLSFTYIYGILLPKVTVWTSLHYNPWHIQFSAAAFHANGSSIVCNRFMHFQNACAS